MLTRFSSLPPLKESQNHSYMYSCVMQNSIFELRQTISLVIYRRKPLTSKRMEQQNSFMLPIASRTNSKYSSGWKHIYVCVYKHIYIYVFCYLERYSFSVHLCKVMSIQVLDPKKEEKCKTVLIFLRNHICLIICLFLLLNHILGSNIIFRTFCCLEKLILPQIA